MTEEAPVQAPTDMAGVGIHLSYLRRDMVEMRKALENITSNYVPINIYLEHKVETEKRVSNLESQAIKRKEFEDSWAGKVWGINVTIGMLIGGILFVLQHYWK